MIAWLLAWWKRHRRQDTPAAGYFGVVELANLTRPDAGVRRIPHRCRPSNPASDLSDDSIIASVRRSIESGETAQLTVHDLERLYRDEIDPKETP